MGASSLSKDSLKSYHLETGKALVSRFFLAYNKANKEEDEMTFEAILPELKAGAKILRKGWSGYELYVTLVSGETFEGAPVTPYLLIKTSDEGFSSFAPTVCDILAEDWIVVA